jgi:hypothetical protein
MSGVRMTDPVLVVWRASPLGHLNDFMTSIADEPIDDEQHLEYDPFPDLCDYAR